MLVDVSHRNSVIPRLICILYISNWTRFFYVVSREREMEQETITLHDAAMELYQYLRAKGGEADFDEILRDLPQLFGSFQASELNDYLSSLNLAESWFFGFRLTDSEFKKLIDMS